jgi:hypothetical protein
MSLDKILASSGSRKPNETHVMTLDLPEGGSAKTVLEMAKTVTRPLPADMFTFMFEQELMDSALDNDSGRALYAAKLKQVLIERYNSEIHPPDSIDRDVAKLRAWAEWKNMLFKDWKPLQTVFMPAITKELLVQPNNVINPQTLCETGIISQAEVIRVAEDIEREKFLKTPRGKILFVEELSAFVKIEEKGTQCSMSFTDEQVQFAKANAWKKESAYRSSARKQPARKPAAVSPPPREDVSAHPVEESKPQVQPTSDSLWNRIVNVILSPFR